ncbi:MAG: thiamine ABC transporter substrate-binding protein [Candidatus Kariarchaeaceae archaeon]
MIIIGILVSVIVIGGGAYLMRNTEQSSDTLIVYTYDSLLAWGTEGGEKLNNLLADFSENEGINVSIQRFTSTDAMITRLIAEKDNPRADVVIGIDSLGALKILDEGIFEPYNSTEFISDVNRITEIPESMINGLDPSLRLVPYDFSVMAWVYNSSFYKESDYPQIYSNFTFDTLLNTSISKTVVSASPLTSSVGKGMLLWQIGVYEKLLGEDWEDFWEEMVEKSDQEEILFTEGWGEAFNYFYDSPPERQIVMSYGTDLAYNQYFGYGDNLKPTLVTYEAQEYGWMQIEGLGILASSNHKQEARALVDWFLSSTIQEEMPLNNWMYPANENAILPEVYQYAINIDQINLINDLFTYDEIKNNYVDWLLSWQEIMIS